MKKTKAILLLVSLLAFTFFLSSCASYKRCKEKFATTVVDSVRIETPVSVIVPRDSVVTSFVTDTTYLVKEVQSGRAKLIIQRTPKLTTIQAECDTVTIYKKVTVTVPVKTLWGVHPRWKTIAQISGALLAINLLLRLVSHFFSIKIQKRK